MASSDVKSFFHVVESGSTCSVAELLKDASQVADLSLKTFVNQRNDLHQSVLHISCSKLCSDITQILLEAGADPNAQDLEGRTPVFLLVERLQECNCEDCMKKAIRCLTTVSFHGASLDIPNSSDITPLYLCAENHFVDFTRSMLENGAALGTVKGTPLIEVVAEKMPAVMSTVFDRAVKVKGSKTNQDPDFELIFDLGVILPPQITFSHQLHGTTNGSVNMNQVFPAEQWFSEKYEPCEEMTFLKQLMNYSGHDSAIYRSILKHPLVNVFTDVKWKSLEALYFCFLSMQVIVLFAYSAFVCATIFLDCPFELYVQLQNGLTSISSHAQKNGIPGVTFNGSDIINPDQLCEINIISKIISAFVIVMTVVILIKEIQHAMYDLKDYLKDIFNYFQLVRFVSVLFTVIVAWNHKSPLYSLLYPAAAFGTVISWCQIFVQIGRLPQLAIYIEMFVKISVNFCISLAIYSFLLIGFAIAFSILFPERPRLMDLPLSMVKIMTMLVGEMDYEDLFRDHNIAARGDNAFQTTSNDSPQQTIQHRFASRVWYVNFLVFITLVLMNLLVGLAVSDIQGIRKDAEMYVIKRRIRYIAYLEKSMFEATALIPKFLQKLMRENICVARPTDSKSKCPSFCFTPIELKSCKLTIFPNNSKKNQYLSPASKMSIRHWLSTKPSSNIVRSCQIGRKNSSTGFRQRNLANFRKASTTSCVVQQPIFVKDITQGTEAERLKRLEFNVHQMDNKMNEIDLKVDMIVKLLMKSD